MAEITAQENEANRPKSAEKSKEKKEKSRPLTKVVIRRLPPTMSEETFLEQISPIPDNDYFYFVNADRTLGLNAFCRAYINFANTDDIFNFKEKFDNYVFVDNRGNEFPAVVEYAPYQGVPKKKSRKNDPKCGTIETDPHYLEFLESLKVDESEVSKQDKTEFSYQVKDDKKKTTTPLLEYLAARKLEKLRIKAERKEERRKKEIERKKLREEERRKRKTEYTKSKPSVIDEETYAEGSSIKEIDSENIKSKSQDYDDSTKSVSKYKGKIFREKRSEEYPRKVFDEKKNDIKIKPRDDRRYNDGDHLRKSEYKPSYTRNKSREEDTKKFDTKRDVRNDTVKSEKKFEVKKYSETRKEREAKRNELKKLTKKNADTEEDQNETVIDEEKVINNDEKSVEILKKIDDDCINLDKKVDELTENIAKITCESDKSKIDKEIKSEDKENYNTTKEEGNNEEFNDKNEIKINEEENVSKKPASDKKSREDRKSDPRTERRIRNKDRPSMAIYQPGKARLSQNKEKSTNEESNTDQKSSN